MDQIKKLGGYPSTGSYAGPNTVRAIDYCGHAVIGLQASDELQDGSAYMILLDDHMQVTVATVMASSIRPIQEGDQLPGHILIADREDYASTRRNLEELARQILSRSPETTDDLRAAAVVLSDLADVIDGQDRAVIQRTEVRRTEEYHGHICGSIVFNDLGQPVGWRDIDLTGGTVFPDGQPVCQVNPTPPMYKEDLICLKCDHCYWTILVGGYPRPICEIDQVKYLDKTECENFKPDTRKYQGR